MKNKNKYNASRLHDHTINCDICGTVCWYSEARTLDNDTGQGGAIVCRRHKDTTDYGLVSYKVPAEQPVTETRVLYNFNDTNSSSDVVGDVPFDLQTKNPLSSN